MLSRLMLLSRYRLRQRPQRHVVLVWSVLKPTFTHTLDERKLRIRTGCCARARIRVIVVSVFLFYERNMPLDVSRLISPRRLNVALTSSKLFRNRFHKDENRLSGRKTLLNLRASWSTSRLHNEATS